MMLRVVYILIKNAILAELHPSGSDEGIGSHPAGDQGNHTAAHVLLIMAASQE